MAGEKHLEGAIMTMLVMIVILNVNVIFISHFGE